MRTPSLAFLICLALAIGVGGSLANVTLAAPATTPSADASDHALAEKNTVVRYYNRIHYYISRSMYNEALQEIEHGLRLDPGYAPFLLQKALVLAKLGQGEESMALTTLAIGAMPDNRELQLLAVENLLTLNKDDKAHANRELADFFAMLGPDRLPDTVVVLTEDFGRHDSRFTQILQAMAASQSLPAPEQAIMIALLDGKPQHAAELLRKAVNSEASGLSRDQAQLRFLGAMSILTAEKLELQGKTGEAEALYAQGVTLGYSKEKMLESKGDTHLEAHAYDKAANVYAEHWRSATDPGLWAVKAANVFSATGRKDKALEILRQARTAYSEDIWLLGQLYLRMALAGKETELQDLSRELEELGLPVALEYGKFLVARQNNNMATANAAKEGVVQHASGITFVYEQEAMRRILKDLGFTGNESPLARQAVRLRNQGWDFWNLGQYEDAYLYWLDSISLMPDPMSEGTTFRMATLLLQQNLPEKALTLLHKQFPKSSPMEFVLPLVFHEQWSALEPLLKSMTPPSAPNLAPWYALALAHSALKNGTVEGLDDKVKNFLATAPPSGATTVTVPDSQVGTTRLTLDQKLYADLLKSFFTELFQQGYVQYFPEVQNSSGFAMLPENERAALLSRSALHMLASGNMQQAAPLLEAALTAAPQWADAHLGMALVEKSRGNGTAAQAHLLLGQTSRSPQKNYVLGRIDMLNNNNRAAEKHFEAYLREEPNNLGAAFELFNLYMGMPNYRKARAVMSRFKNKSDSESMLYLAQCEAALGNWREGERVLHALLARVPGHAPAILALVATLRAQERFDEAAALLAANGLEDPEVLTALRIKAEKALMAGHMAEARLQTEQFLKKSPDNVYLNSLYNSSLRDEYRQQNDALEILVHDYDILHKGQTNARLLNVDHLRTVQNLDEQTLASMKADHTLLDAAERHAESLLQRNAIQRNALESLLDIALQKKDFREAERISRFMTAAHPYDTHYQLQAAIHTGSTGQFAQALPEAEKLAHKGPNAAGMALHFVNVASGSGHRSYTSEDIANYLNELAPNYKLVSLTHFLTPEKGASASQQADKIPLLLVVGQATPQEILSLDADLQKRGGKAVLMVDERSFIEGVPAHLPDVTLLRTLVDSGRWELALTDTTNRTIIKDQQGTEGSFWAESGMQNGRPETEEEMRMRWRDALARIKESARVAGFDIGAWMYPKGDYGQLNLDGTPEIRKAYTSAVNELFDIGMVPSYDGYHTDSVNPHFLPVRNVYGSLDDLALTVMPQMHPNRLAVQTEAMLASWHGQLPRAERLFERASGLGLAPRDVAYYRTANAIYDGDAPYANQLARTALAADPESLRAENQEEQAKRMLRPRMSFVPRWWSDNADRSYAEYTLNFSTHIRENLAASFHVSDITWRDDDNTQHGRGVGVGLRYFPFKQHWLDLTVGGVLRDGSNNNNLGFGQWGASWRGAYATDVLNLNGIYTVSYNRESLETGQSVEDGIYADRFAFSSQTRLLNWGVLEAEAYGVSRTGGNNTKGMTVSPLYILWDKPQIRVGYLFGMADSDRNPPEYYAPQEYINHMAIASAQYEVFDGFSLRGMVGYGTAKTKGKNWEQVVRYNTQLNWQVSDDWSFNASYQRLELPAYNMDQFSLGVQYIF